MSPPLPLFLPSSDCCCFSPRWPLCGGGSRAPPTYSCWAAQGPKTTVAADTLAWSPWVFTASLVGGEGRGKPIAPPCCPRLSPALAQLRNSGKSRSGASLAPVHHTFAQTHSKKHKQLSTNIIWKESGRFYVMNLPKYYWVCDVFNDY